MARSVSFRMLLLNALVALPILSASAQAGVQARGRIRHVVVIFNENVSFDHYFGTYPHALNPAGEPAFTALPGTPAVDGYTDELLKNNPNFRNEQNGAGRTNPFRLRRDQAATADQGHSYKPEQTAFHGGAMDLFPFATGRADGPKVPGEKAGIPSTNGLTMGYFDGNTVTAFWNYAQHYSMSDRHFGVVFGPSTPGAINLISGTTNGAMNDGNATGLVADGGGGWTMVTDPDPSGDICSVPGIGLVHMTSRNVGDLLNAAKVSWGWFEGGFDLTRTNANGTTGCKRMTVSVPQLEVLDYIPHHQPFQYYASTANPRHVRPRDVKSIGANDDGGANHQYDSHDFTDALRAGNFPAVVFLKAPAFADGHAGYSDPLDEQRFTVETINALQQSPEWEHTVVFIAYDDSDGWYDHVKGPTRTGSASIMDALDGPGKCGDPATAMPGVNPATEHASGRCGFGPRLPLLVVSPWAKQNYVDHSLTDQTSVLRFIEDLFLNGERIGQGSFDSVAGDLGGLFDFSGKKPKNAAKLTLDPESGLVVGSASR